MESKLKYSDITTEKIVKGVCIAKCEVYSPFKTTVEMRGKTEEIAKKKLELFLNNEPYKHLDS
ncbi:hypothetical protein ACVVIH_20550 [Chryseobacterium arthrosphaerae]